MGSRSDFWLTMHKLASDLLKEGETNSERAENICKLLNVVTPATRGLYLENLDAVVPALEEVVKHCKSRP